MKNDFSLISPIEIHFGEGTIKEVKGILKNQKRRNVCLISDPIVRKLGLLNELEEMIRAEGAGLTVLDEVEPEPSVIVAQKLLDKIRRQSFDLVIGVGGGSALDISKAIAVLATHEGGISDYLNLTGTKKLSNKGLTKVMIPTTAGTGAEVTDIAVFSTGDSKDVMTDKHLLADYVIVDPALTYSLPKRVTAAGAVDAFTHAIESFTSKHSNPLTDIFSKDAMWRINNWIRVAVWNGEHKEARRQLSLGSLEAGISFYNAGVAGVHALAYPLGGQFKVSHGESNAVLLPYVYAKIWPSCISQLVEVSRIIGTHHEDRSNRDNARYVVAELFNLVSDLDLPTKLSDYGISKGDLDQLTDNALKQVRLLGRSPMNLSRQDIYEIYLNAFEGNLKF
ncbi:iron-containing alcohol dehydrogenase [Bhargavaea beijingensis]|uniref:iron-containing alcohol dehydrogenase n=1 Tax=Bhargavaea beijingensis TaxID=426756 RepID=UPI0022243FE9|nr:iron-containing alcohol dehydrogenase [Bhargavaea beijingensis]MCW1927387.1 iron-containing alcohol dehydrogenase [Bhargavaea beijingensis]